MARKKEPGITYYSMQADHTLHPKIRLIYNDFGSDGYWIWSCLLDRIYKHRGYYFCTRLIDELELFASDVCKKPIDLVNSVIAGCIKRKLFDQDLYDNYGVLTSERIQVTYLRATEERRRKGTTIEIIEPLSLISDELDDIPYKERIDFISLEELDSSVELFGSSVEESAISGEQSPKESKVNKSKVKKNLSSPDGAGVGDPEKELKKKYDTLGIQLADTPTKGDVINAKKAVYEFITANKPQFIEPYVMLWNLFAIQNGKPQIITITDKRKKKFKVRINEEKFDFIKILTKAKESKFLMERSFFTFDWLIVNESNYLKVLEGNYTETEPEQEQHTGGSKESDIRQRQKDEERTRQLSNEE